MRRNIAEHISSPVFPPEAAGIERFIACFPYPIQVFAADGTLVMVNDTFLKRFDIDCACDIVGRYNVLQDPTTRQYGVESNVDKVFGGQTVIAKDVRIPLHLIKRDMGIPVHTREMHFENIVSFPITDSDGKLMFVANIYSGEQNYKERGEIIDAIAHIEAHWKEGFSIDTLAHSVNLSPSYFCRLFKEHTGITPHEYYTKYKIDRLKERLLDANLTVEQAFTACGVAYHGYYARLFRQKTGYSPSQYRKLARS